MKKVKTLRIKREVVGNLNEIEMKDRKGGTIPTIITCTDPDCCQSMFEVCGTTWNPDCPNTCGSAYTCNGKQYLIKC